MNILKVLFRMLRLGRAERGLKIVFFCAAFGVAAAQIIEPMLFGKVIDALSQESRFNLFVMYWVGIGTVNAALSIFLAVFTDRFAHRQRMHAMELAFERTISMPFHLHSLKGSGRIVRTIQIGSDGVFFITLSFFRENLIALGCVVILVPLAFSLEPRLAGYLCTLALVYTICNWLVIRRTYVRQAAVELKHQDLSARIIDVMANVTVVRSFTRVKQEVALFGEMVRSVLNAQYPVLTWWGILNVITRLSSMAAMVTIVALGSTLVQKGVATGGQIVTFVGFSTLLISRLEQLSAFVNRILGQLPTARNLFELIDQVEPELARRESFQISPPQGRITFENVTFRYGRSETAQGVFNLNFTIEPGQTIALVGSTGAGKSTCLALLQRLYSPITGRILIDGQDIENLEVQTLCGEIATVFQEPGLFNRSLYENILVGRPEAARAEVEEAARRADAEPFILARPNGYDFVVGERGLALSGGERQRVAIARAILKDAPILLLDEATSALDNETEKRVQAAMDRLSEGRTTIVIAHRLSTVLSADRILVMSEGRVIQSGTFLQLRNTNGLFARLLAAGELGETPAPEEMSNLG